MYLRQLSLVNFRNYSTARIEPAPLGVTLFQGPNGAGKTNVLEAVAYLSNSKSFRGSPKESVIMNGAQQAVLRGQVDREGRQALVEIELNAGAKDKVRLNRQPLRRQEELASAVLVSVFSPDDIEVVKGPPQLRREYLDALLSSLHARNAQAQADMERVIRQRNALLKSAGGSLRGGMASTLDVWDAKLAQSGEQVAEARRDLVSKLQPGVDNAYRLLAGLGPIATGEAPVITMTYEQSWQGPLAPALLARRAEDVRRGTTSVGPHRDDMLLYVGNMTARSQASQGEQRSLALALRLGGHRLATERQGTSPVLLLDDVFSELDPVRSAALIDCLPEGQTLVTTAGPAPARLAVVRCTRVTAGALVLADVEIGVEG